ncbi:hypothetical protein CSKR_203741 [Clonorchis sinensis]|uniref:Uncharacterized protein n=1 Tax=Clonorchis sinensis TaxID=79923 RepID=A0A8T1N140_CLOSI|nr:hypothetical protein CSKR_203741 [Clonorchis sinensis]
MALLWSQSRTSNVFECLGLIALFLTLLLFVVAIPKPPLPTNHTQHAVFANMELLVSEFSRSALAAPVLIDDLDLDGQLDLYFATIDGQLHGIQGFSHCALHSECDKSHWSTYVGGGHFVSSAVLLPVEGTGQSLLLFASDRGTLFLLEHIGNVVAQVQIPAVLLPHSASSDQRYWLDSVHLASKLQWDLDFESTENNSDFYRLRPRVYASPVIVKTRTDTSGAISVIVPVSFEDTDSDHLLVALVEFSQRSLLSTSLWGSARSSRPDLLVLVPLHLGKLGVSPPYLLTSPLVVSNPQISSANSQRTWHPGFALLITVSNGYLFRVSLPLGAPNGRVQLLWSDPTTVNEFAHSCYLVSYAPSRLGCLLLDNSSNLRMIDVSPLDSGRTHSLADRLVWEYRPTVMPLDSSLQQLAQITVVPDSSCHDQMKNGCSLWAVYPDSNGYVHAVDIQSGRAVPHFPVRIDGFPDIALIFASGPGILYKSADSMSWLLFSDVAGCFYHLRLNDPPIILRGDQTCGIQSAINEITHWLTPILITQHQLQPTVGRLSSQPEPLSLIVAHNGGIAILTTTPKTSSSNTSSIHRTFVPHHMFKYGLFDVNFLNNDGQPTNVVHLHSDEEVIHYVIHDCLLHTDYLVQLLDSSGASVSEWSRPKPSTSARSILSNHSDCVGSLSIFRSPPEGPFRSRLYLHAVELGTGRLLTTPYRLTSQQYFAASILLEFHTFWPQLIVFWTYLLFVFFLIGLGVVSYGTILLRNKKACIV